MQVRAIPPTRVFDNKSKFTTDMKRFRLMRRKSLQVSRLKVAIENTNDKEMSHKVAELERALGDANHLNTQSFEEYLFMPIFKKRKLQDGYKSRRRSGAMGYSRDGGEQQTFRKGLSYGEEKIYT